MEPVTKAVDFIAFNASLDYYDVDYSQDYPYVPVSRQPVDELWGYDIASADPETRDLELEALLVNWDTFQHEKTEIIQRISLDKHWASPHYFSGSIWTETKESLFDAIYDQPLDFTTLYCSYLENRSVKSKLLAQHTRISETTVYGYHTGHGCPNTDHLIRICLYLRLPLADAMLLFMTDPNASADTSYLPFFIYSEMLSNGAISPSHDTPSVQQYKMYAKQMQQYLISAACVLDEPYDAYVHYFDRELLTNDEIADIVRDPMCAETRTPDDRGKFIRYYLTFYK